MWSARLGNRILHFHLAGINNQNFIMADEETGSWWQQVSGLAVQGPLRGARLVAVPWDEVSWAAWKQEHADTRVLAWDEAVATRYARSDWETRMAGQPVVTPVDPADRLEPRALVAGVEAGGQARAYSLEWLRERSPLLDELGGVPIALVLGADGRSVRAFRRDIEGRTLELFVATPLPTDEAGTLELLDAETGSRWDFTGMALSGPLAGRQLSRVQVVLDYWFDWKQHHGPTSPVTGP